MVGTCGTCKWDTDTCTACEERGCMSHSLWEPKSDAIIVSREQLWDVIVGLIWDHGTYGGVAEGYPERVADSIIAKLEGKDV